MTTTSDTRRLFLFYLAPEFTLLAFTSALETLRLANQVIGDEVYEWRIVTSDGKAVRASCGLSITPDLALVEARKLRASGVKLGMAIVCAGRNVQKHLDRSLDQWLRECRSQRIPLGAICTGAHLLAKAGLLVDKRCTIHWENYPSFAEAFSDSQARPQLYEVDDGIYTCAGGTSSLDMMLHIVSEHHGSEAARKICQQAIVGTVRHRSERQRLPFSLSQDIKHRTLQAAIELMAENVAQTLPLAFLAKKVGISRRQLERQFQTSTGCSPSRFYVKLRVERARALLEQTAMPVVEVAIACGFTSGSHFAKVYRTSEGESPIQTRKPQRSKDRMASSAVMSG
ncbi:GlxA family transcriptional regulator [Ensifer sp. LC163]|uniref:GlxA family transcriptional regulator n=1 Tax=Ensifer sp. LC163 TaxID=1120652 RepID=UPI0008137832|nr:GlxA family transcriptional regulator [Ensifer sp. LC163]OCP14953.1 AraC family transcriptional regulator [Ensifer sp. LC163]